MMISKRPTITAGAVLALALLGCLAPEENGPLPLSSATADHVSPDLLDRLWATYGDEDSGAVILLEDDISATEVSDGMAENTLELAKLTLSEHGRALPSLELAGRSFAFSPARTMPAGGWTIGWTDEVRRKLQDSAIELMRWSDDTIGILLLDNNSDDLDRIPTFREAFVPASLVDLAVYSVDGGVFAGNLIIAIRATQAGNEALSVLVIDD